MKKKTIALMLSVALAFAAAVGGTLAWFTDVTPAVTNTFTIGNIDIELKEHDYDPATKSLDSSVEVGENNNYHFVPGDILLKDPFVRVKEGSEPCFIFVKVEAIHNDVAAVEGKHDELTGIIQYAVDDAVWKTVEINGAEQVGYYYCEIDAADTKQDVIKSILKPEGSVIDADYVRINDQVTKSMVEQINAAKPQLKFTAAAIQRGGLPVVIDEESYQTAWKYLPDGFKPSGSEP